VELVGVPRSLWSLGDPCGPVLQTSAAICPAGKWQRLFDRGVGGSRTRVHTWRPYAFYMLSSACFSWSVSCRTT